MKAQNKHALDHWDFKKFSKGKGRRAKGGFDHASRMKSDSTQSDWTAADRRGASCEGLYVWLGR